MKYALLVAWREFIEGAKAKGFWLGILMMPAMLFLSIQAPIWLEQKATPVRYYVLVDQSGSFAPVVEAALDKAYQRQVFESLNEYARKNAASPDSPAMAGQAPGPSDPEEDNPRSVENFISSGGKEQFLKQLQPRLKPNAPPFTEPRRFFRQVPLPDGISANAEVSSLAEALKPYLRGEKHVEVNGQSAELIAAILIPKNIKEHIQRPPGLAAVSGSNHVATAGNAGSDVTAQSSIQYWSVNASETRLRDDIERSINSEVRRREYLARGMDGVAIRQVEQTSIAFASLNPKKEKGKEAINTTDIIKQWTPSGFVYLLWLAIFVIVQMLLNNTIEEKSNRIIEVLLSSVTPGELMMGKLLGIAATGLTMICAWMLALFGILSWKSGGTSQIAGQLLVVLKTSNLVPLFSIYFLLGYLMYAAFILSIGSVCNTIKEAQSYMGVLTMVMMVPLMTMTYIPRDPNGPIARLLSWIPIYTPFTMMNRASADPPLVDMVGTMTLLVGTTVLALWMCGKVFRIGILRTGQPPKIIEMLRWATRSEK